MIITLRCATIGQNIFRPYTRSPGMVRMMPMNDVIALPSLLSTGAHASHDGFAGDATPRMVVVIPAHDEERFIGSVVLRTRMLPDAPMVIVVDDGSHDATAEIAAAAGAVVVQHTTNMGKGGALNTGFGKARELEPDVVITMDGDWQHLPEELRAVAEPVLRGDADIVVGSRYLEGGSGYGSGRDVPVSRLVGHWGFTSLTNAASGVALTDSQSGYRAFSPRALNTLQFKSARFSVESEMQFLARDHDLKVVEVPITIRYLDKPKRNLFQHGWVVLNGLIQLVAQHRPLLFFAVPGVLMLIVGVIIGALVVHSYNLYQSLALGTALIAVVLCIVGILAVVTGVILHAMRLLTMEIKGSIEGR